MRQGVIGPSQRVLLMLPVFVLWLFAGTPSGVCADASTGTLPTEIFPPIQDHVHGSTIVELPNGDLLTAWFQGSGERWADDVTIMGARLKKSEDHWSKPFLMADTPGFPDINPILFLDAQNRLWLVWYTVIANQWETSLLKYRISDDYAFRGEGVPPSNRGQNARDTEAPKWAWQDVLHVKPGDLAERGIQPSDRFVKSVERQIEEYATYLREGIYASQPAQGLIAVGMWKAWGVKMLANARGEDMVRKGQLRGPTGELKEANLGYPYFQRMGWQTKNKAVLVDGKRLIVPLYSDGFSFSLMAITDDGGGTWRFSEPLVAAGNIQPSIAKQADGTLVAYMRDNGPAPKRLHISTSKDKGMTWSPVKDSDLPNPGSGADIVTLRNGHWVLAYNDTEKGRESLAVSLSLDEGKTWPCTQHLESGSPDKSSPSGAYPSIIQAADDSLHVVYSFHGVRKTIKHARFTEAWLMGR
jgi:predicted neuraminidase